MKKPKFEQQPVNDLRGNRETVSGGLGNNVETNPNTFPSTFMIGGTEPGGLGTYCRKSIVDNSVFDIRIKDIKWTVKLTANNLQGLSNLESLEPYTGMMFNLTGNLSKVPINMEDMRFPLDIIFIDENDTVAKVLKDIMPGNDVIYSGTPVRYFFEVNAGETDSVKAGDKIQTSDKIFKSVDNILISINNLLKGDSRIYLTPGENPPNNEEVFTGKRGGKFYNTSNRNKEIEQTSIPISNIENSVKERISKNKTEERSIISLLSASNNWKEVDEHNGTNISIDDENRITKTMKIYLSPNEAPPKDTKIFIGPKGGKYYYGSTEHEKSWKSSFLNYSKRYINPTDGKSFAGIVGAQPDFIANIIHGAKGEYEQNEAYKEGVVKAFEFIDFYIKLTNDSKSFSNNQIDYQAKKLAERIEKYLKNPEDTADSKVEMSIKIKCNDLLPELKFGDRSGKIMAIDKFISINHQVEPTIIPHIFGVKKVAYRIPTQDFIIKILDYLFEHEDKMEKSFTTLRQLNRKESLLKNIDSLLQKEHQANPPYPGTEFNEIKHRWVKPVGNLQSSKFADYDSLLLNALGVNSTQAVIDSLGPELAKVLNEYTIIAKGDAPDNIINNLFDRLKTKALDENGASLPFYGAGNIQQNFIDAEKSNDRLDKIIAIDSFMFAIHQDNVKPIILVTGGSMSDWKKDDKVKNVLDFLRRNTDSSDQRKIYYRRVEAEDKYYQEHPREDDEDGIEKQEGAGTIASGGFTPTFSGGDSKKIKKEDSQLERISELEHEQWQSWAKVKDPNHPLINTSYDELTEEEKEKDREWARKVIDELKKSKVYLNPGEEPPDNMIAQQGPKGGRYYESVNAPKQFKFDSPGSIEPKTEADKTLLNMMQQYISWILSSKNPNLKYNSTYEMVVKNGKFYTPGTRPPENKQRDKECFKNAAMLSLDNHELTYVEGFAMIKEFPGLPFSHAWCVDKEGNVFDNTWKEPGISYFGIPFTTEYLRDVLIKTKVFGVIPEIPRKNYDPFTDGFPRDAIKKAVATQPKVYVSPGQRPPENVELQRGKRGGEFYNPTAHQQKPVEQSNELEIGLPDIDSLEQAEIKWGESKDEIRKDINIPLELRERATEGFYLLQDIIHFSAKGSKTIACGDHNNMFGVCNYREVTGPHNSIEVDFLAASPEVNAYQKVRGVGSSLMTKLIRHAHNENFDSVSLHALQDAVPFYEKLGFAKHKTDTLGSIIMTMDKHGIDKYLNDQQLKKQFDEFDSIHICNKELAKFASIKKSIDDIIKGKVYLKPGKNAPQGQITQIGKYGGKYYWTSKKYNDKKRTKVEMPEVLFTSDNNRVPPAWTDVWISNSPTEDIQATGFDSAGRKVYLYSKAFTEQQKGEKFQRLKEFGDSFNKFEKIIEQKASKSDEALILYIIMKTGFRIGSEQEHIAKVKAYGISTLQKRHITINGSKVTFDFIGKKGVRNKKTVNDEFLANRLNNKIGKKGPDDNAFDTTSALTRKYFNALPGAKRFKIKDFRTYIGTSLALNKVKKLKTPETYKEFKKIRKEISEAVAKELGNTPAVALRAYISPEVFSRWEAKFSDMIKKSDSENMKEFFDSIILPSTPKFYDDDDSEDDENDDFDEDYPDDLDDIEDENNLE